MKLKPKEIAEYVKSMRESVDWTAKQLAEALGESENIIKRIERGTNTGLKINPFLKVVQVAVSNERKKRRAYK